MENFAVFILSHGRANNLPTLKTLEKQGYTGKTYIIVDDMDEQQDEYIKNYGDKVIIFNKKESAKNVDTADNLQDYKGIIYARNYCHELAKKLGLEYFLVLDDDYTSFDYRWAEGDKLLSKTTKKLDEVFKLMLDFLDVSGALTVAFAQGGDYIGGANGTVIKKRVLRKAMNSFFCRTDRPFKFYGRVNEDTSMYVLLNNMGATIFTIADFMLIQGQTQANAGGMTTLYLEGGTYVKSFYSILYAPQAVKVALMGSKHMRMHHRVSWNVCSPKIIWEGWKKEGRK